MTKMILYVPVVVGLTVKSVADYVIDEIYDLGIKFQEAHLQSGDTTE
jgi:hypothetical protein